MRIGKLMSTNMIIINEENAVQHLNQTHHHLFIQSDFTIWLNGDCSTLWHDINGRGRVIRPKLSTRQLNLSIYRLPIPLM